MNYTYIIRCSDGSFYTGWTNDLEARVVAHNSGRGARYTRGRGPVTLEYFETYDDQCQAQKREWEIKQLSRKQKELLVESGGAKKA